MSRASCVPSALAPAELDDYLARGWYRVGASLFTSRYLLSDGELRSTVWTRSRIEGHRFGRNARRLLRRNDALLRRELRPAAPDTLREALYQRYLQHVGPGRSASLSDFLRGEGDPDVFDTWEIGFYQGEALVGFSWFDRGASTLQSLIGVFDPDRAHLSLGRYSLLCEVRLCIEEGRDFHYSGYVLPGDPKMDYKLSAGGIEFLDDRDLRWRPWAEFDPAEAPLERLRERLRRVVEGLGQRGLRASLLDNPAFDLPHFHEPLAHCATEPLLVAVPTRQPGASLLVSAPEGEGYRVVVGQQGSVVVSSTDPRVAERTLPVWGCGRVLAEGLDLDAVVSRFRGG
jgi:leucyl-tRNA---protein transferase